MQIPKASSIVKRFYPQFGLRKSDILLSSFPKSGNTWVRFIWANIVSLMELGGREIDFKYLNTELVAEYDSHSYGDVEFDCLPRLVKTHRRYDARAFGQNRSVYLVRHPGDVMVSYFEFRRARQGVRDPSENGLKAFIRNKEYGVPAWCEHVRSWRSRADEVIHYEDLKANAEAVIQMLLEQFSFDHVENDVIKKAIERSSFDRLKSVEKERGGAVPDYFDSNFRFMRSGRTEEWKERYEKDDVEYMRSKIREATLNDLYSM